MAAVPLPGPGDALIVVDTPTAPLPDRRGLPANALLDHWIAAFAQRGLPVVAARDWNLPYRCIIPARATDRLPRCRSEAATANFAQPQARPGNRRTGSGLPDRVAEGCSCFAGTGLHPRLQALRVGRLFVGGCAGGGCVLETVEDSLSLGYAVIVLADCVRAVDSPSGDAARALAAMRASGTLLLES